MYRRLDQKTYGSGRSKTLKISRLTRYSQDIVGIDERFPQTSGVAEDLQS
jgi:hypothetical protein